MHLHYDWNFHSPFRPDKILLLSPSRFPIHKNPFDPSFEPQSRRFLSESLNFIKFAQLDHIYRTIAIILIFYLVCLLFQPYPSRVILLPITGRPKGDRNGWCLQLTRISNVAPRNECVGVWSDDAMGTARGVSVCTLAKGSQSQECKGQPVRSIRISAVQTSPLK